MNSAGAFCNVSTDSASRLAGRIWNVVKTQVSDRARDVSVNDTGLDHSKPVGFVDLKNPAHARHLNDHAAIEGQRTA
jgi:hypothetical protein